MIKEIKQNFRGSGISVTTDKEESYFNFKNRKGINCEFYTSGGEYLTANYSIDGVDCDMDFHYEDDSFELLQAVQKILDIPKTNKIKAVKQYPKLRLVV